MITLIILLPQSTMTGQSLRIGVTVLDSQTRIPVTGAEITIDKKTLKSDNEGKFILNHNAGKIKIDIKKDKFELRSFDVSVSSDTSLVLFYEKAIPLDEINVVASRVKGFTRDESLEIAKLTPDEISFLPGIGSNDDLFKRIQMLPGIKSGGEGSSGLIVRGGQYDQNLCNINGFPVYQPYHFSGFLSAIDPFMVSEMEIMKGGFPARYGGKLSSVVNFKSYDSVSDSVLSYLNAGIFISGAATRYSPDTLTTISLSGRIGTTFLLKKVIDLLIPQFPFLNFYDFNLNASRKLNEKNSLSFTLFLNKDYFNKLDTFTYQHETYSTLHIKSNARSDWHDVLAGISWTNRPSNNLRMLTNLYYQDFLSESYQDIKTVEKNDDDIHINSSQIKETGLTSDLTLNKGKHNLDFGLFSNLRFVTPEVATNLYRNGELAYGTGSADLSQNNFQIEAGLYIEDQFLVNEKTTLRPGFRVTVLAGPDFSYVSPEPRLYISHKLTDKVSLMGSYTITTQSIQMISSSNVMSVGDLWVPATRITKPSKAYQGEFGVFFNNRKFLTAEVNIYYKKIKDLYIYKEGASFVISPQWNDNITTASGKAYGAELLVQADLKNTYINVGYTISRTTRQSQEVNNGKEFNYKYDKPHDLNITIGYRPTSRLSLSCSWVFQSGKMFSYYNRLYQADIYDYYEGQDLLPYIDKINNIRFPYYHRLDIGLERKKPRKWGKTVLKFDIYNVYSKLNPWYLYQFGSQYDVISKGFEYLHQVTLFPIIPSVGYRVEF